jgi:hypothetical protein
MKDKLQRLIEGIKKADYKDCDKEHMARRAEERINELQQRGVHCVDRFVQKLLDRVDDKDAYLDILMEGRFAIILARNGFKELHIEYCSEGPDIKAEYNGQTIYFEVTRRHADEDEWAGRNGVSWASSDRVENIIARIREKLRQLQSGEINIVVLWSDAVSLGEREVKEAFDYIIQEDQETRAYKALSGLLLTEGGGVDVATMKQFYLFENDKASKPIGVDLGRKLESLFERDIEEWQKEIEDLTAAVKQLKAKRNL